MTDHSEALAVYDDEWGGIEVREPFEKLPDGVFQVEIEEARVEKSDSNDYNPDGRLQFVLGMRVVSGHFEGASHRKWTNLDSDMGRKIVKNDLHVMDLDLPKLSDLPGNTGLLLGVKVEVKIQTKDNPNNPDRPYTNTYINKRINSENAIEPPVIADDTGPVMPPGQGEDFPW